MNFKNFEPLALHSGNVFSTSSRPLLSLGKGKISDGSEQTCISLIKGISVEISMIARLTFYLNLYPHWNMLLLFSYEVSCVSIFPCLLDVTFKKKKNPCLLVCVLKPIFSICKLWGSSLCSLVYFAIS